MTEKLPYLPAFIALVLMLAGYHFNALELKIIGGIYLGWASISHFRNVQIMHKHFNKRRQIL